MADGSSRFLNYDIDGNLYLSLCTKSGGETVGEF